MIPVPQPAGSVISAERVAFQKRTRFNPLRLLDPQKLGEWLDGFASGQLREFALLADAIARRDDTLAAVVAKRVGGPARHGYQILIGDDVPDELREEAERHKAALEFCYANLTATDAVDRDARGGFKLLVRQMLRDALGLRKAAHEILWSPSPEGLTATLQRVPLWFFEQRSGKLRFLPSDTAYDGVDLQPGAWMITSAECALLEASAVAYTYKRMALQDWVNFNDRFGFPIIDAATDAAPNSPEWAALSQAVDELAREVSLVRSRSAEINLLEVANSGTLPFEPLAERMDRALARIWRGADLSTMSAGQGPGQGASLQGDESALLEEDDADLVSETLNEFIDRQVIAWHFGPGVKPLAYVKIIVPRKRDAAQERETDKFLIERGARLSVADALERYDRTPADADDVVLTNPAPSAAPAFGGGLFPRPPAVDGANEVARALTRAAAATDDPATRRLIADARRSLGRATAAELAPLAKRLAELNTLTDPVAWAANAQRLVAELRNPASALRSQLDRTDDSADALAQAVATSLLRGLEPNAANEAAPIGHCPTCGARGVMRERRINGNDRCENGHTYPSKTAVATQPRPA